MKISEPIHDLPIAEVIEKHVALKKQGANHTACCPLHNEKTPSFIVFGKTNTFKCFGCGKGGDAINFIMELKQLDFIEACKLIAQDHGLALDFKEEKEPDPTARERRTSLLELMHHAQQYFVNQLKDPENKPAFTYALRRWNPETIKTWSMGYAPNQWHGLQNHAKALGFTDDELKEAGLISESKGKTFDTFRNRLMFPITNLHGKVIAFSGRDLSDVTKTPPDTIAPSDPTVIN